MNVEVNPELAWRLERPKDHPDARRRCTKCRKLRPETEEYFATYQSRGLWYRRPSCKECNRKRDASKNGPRITDEQLAKQSSGKLLLDIETRLQGVKQEISKASLQYKEVARDFWLQHLDKISSLTEEAIQAITREGLEEFLLQITKEGKK